MAFASDNPVDTSKGKVKERVQYYWKPILHSLGAKRCGGI